MLDRETRRLDRDTRDRNVESIQSIPDEVLPDNLHRKYLHVAAAAGLFDVHATRAGERWTIWVGGRAYSPEEWMRTDWRDVNLELVRGASR